MIEQGRCREKEHEDLEDILGVGITLLESGVSQARRQESLESMGCGREGTGGREGQGSKKRQWAWGSEEFLPQGCLGHPGREGVSYAGRRG